MSDGPEADFWRFSLALYRRPGVASALIGVQDRLGADVNVMLFCLWHAVRGRALTPVEIAAAVRASGAWHRGIVRRVRHVRRALKTELAAGHPPGVAAPARRMRETVKRIEIESERIEQMMLVAAVPVPRRQAVHRGAAHKAREGLRHYLSSLGRPVAAADRAAIGQVIAAAFGGKIT